MSAAQTKAQSIIDEHAVVVFSKSYCPYCKASKKTLKDANIDAFIIELDEIEDGQSIQDAIKALYKHNTVPAIFINHKLLGGNDALQAAKSKGQLESLIAGASSSA